MSLVLLLPTMPASGPLSGGWSLWDIGCCCQNEVLCGCSELDNYEDDFASGVLTGWTTNGNAESASGLMRLKTPTNIVTYIERCLVLPEWTDKKLVFEFTFVTMNQVAFYERLIATINFLASDTPCIEHYIWSLTALENFAWSSRANTLGDTVTLTTGQLEGTVFKVEITEAVPLPNREYLVKTYVDNVLVHTHPQVGPFTDDHIVARLHMDWQTTSALELDNMTFGVYDV